MIGTVLPVAAVVAAGTALIILAINPPNHRPKGKQ